MFAIGLLARVGAAHNLPGARASAEIPTADLAVAGAARRIPAAFSGLSIEYNELDRYEASPVMFSRIIALIRSHDGEPMLLRVGGKSADDALWRAPRRHMPGWVFRIGDGWLRRLAALAARDQLRVMLDLNLAVHSPTMAAGLAAAAEEALPGGALAGLAIGNEPDLYPYQPGLENERIASTMPSTPTHWIEDYSPARYHSDYRAYALGLARAVPGVPLAAPEMTTFRFGWVTPLMALGSLRPQVIAIHRYASSTCWPPNLPLYPTIPSLLSERSTRGLAQSLDGAIAFARSTDTLVRVTELGSVSCGGAASVSDSFATALWAPDALFELARAGVAGVNWHIRPGLVTAAFQLTAHGVAARPELYGLALFAQMMRPGANLMNIRQSGASVPFLKTWAVSSAAGLDVLLINKGPLPVLVRLRTRASARAAVLSRLLAPTIDSRYGVTLAGQWIGTDARWHGPRRTALVRPADGVYTLRVGRYSASLLRIG